MKRVAARYVGRVQGVGFRATARAIAGRHGVTGWVRNEADGSVTLEAQGPKQNVEGFLATLRNQMSAMIEREYLDDIAVIAGETSFEVRR